MSLILSRAKSVVGVVVVVGALVTLGGLIVMWSQYRNADTGYFPVTDVKVTIIGVALAFILNVLMHFLGCMHFAVASFAIYTYCGQMLARLFRYHDRAERSIGVHLQSDVYLFFVGALIAFGGYFLTCAAILPYAERVVPRGGRVARPQFVVAAVVMILTLIGGIWSFVDDNGTLMPMFWGVYFFLADAWHLDYLVDSYVFPIGAVLWAMQNALALGAASNAPNIITYVGLCLGLAWLLFTLVFPGLREGGFRSGLGAPVGPAAAAAPKGAVAA